MHRETRARETRGDRRRRETRARLIEAARRLIARRGSLEALPIAEVTEEADVAIGSFYNHFGSKQQLFEAVVTDTIERHGQRIDAVTAGIPDVAEACAVGIRLTVRMVEDDPIWGSFLVNAGLYIARLESSLLHRLASHLHRGFESGRFATPDRMTSLALIGGAVFGAMAARRLGIVPEEVDSLAAQQLLGLLGLPTGEAAEIAQRPLPGRVPGKAARCARESFGTDEVGKGGRVP